MSAASVPKPVPADSPTLVSVAERHSAKTPDSGLLPVPNWSARIPVLDGLRGIAILLVLMRHSIFGDTNSKFLSKVAAAADITWSGVDLFFVLSGFLIGGILLDARESPRYFKTFYIRRAYRIFPLYGTVTALFLFRHLPFHLLPGGLGDASPLTIPWAAYVTLTQNFWMVHLGWYGAVAMSVTWSLAVEEQFYLTIPFLVRKIRPARLLYVLLGVVVLAPALRTLLRFALPHGDFAGYVLMPCRADALCLGVLAAMLVRNQRGWNLLLRRRNLLCGITAVLFAGIVFMAYEGYSQFSAPMTTLGYSWLAMFYTGCLLTAVTASAGKVQTILTRKWLTRLGTLAYCSYLVHVPAIEASRRLLGFRMSSSDALLPGALFGVALALLIATLSWHFFEKPLLRRGHTYTY